MLDISASVQFIGGTTELMITPPIAEPSRPAMVKRLRVSTPYSSTVWTRAVVRRQFAMSSSSRKTPRTVFVLPTSTVSSIRCRQNIRSLFGFAAVLLCSGYDRPIQCYVTRNDGDGFVAAIRTDAQEAFRAQSICDAYKSFLAMCDAHTLAASETRHRFEVADHALGAFGDELIVVGPEFAQQPN